MFFEKIGWRWVVIAIFVVGLIVVYACFNPATAGWFPQCPFRMATGWQCIGCGSQRALHALLHGHWGEVWRYNAAIVLMLPYLLALCFTAATRQRWPRAYMALRHYRVVRVLIVLLLFWGVARNIWGWYV